MLMEQLPFFNDLSPEMRNIILRILLVVLVVLVIWGSRRLLAWLIARPLKWIANRSRYNLDDVVVNVVLQPVRYLIIAFGLAVSVRILGIEDGITIFIQAITRTLVIIALFLLLYRLVDLLAKNSSQLFTLTGLHVEERLLPFARTVVKVIIGALAVVIVVQEWGYDVSGLIAGLGLFGLAFSLAAKDTAENMFGFSAIVGDSPFNVGEFIKTPDVEGIIEHVGIRSTRVRRLDQALVTVPNSKLAQSPVLNWSRLNKRWYNTTLGVTYSASSDEIRELVRRIREMLASRPLVDPESIVVHFVDFGDSSLDILVRGYVMLANWGEFTAEKEQIHLAIMDIVADMGLAIAFPSRSLYIEQMPRRFFEGAEGASVKPGRIPAPDAQPSVPEVNPSYRDLSDEQDMDEPPQQPR